VEGWQCNRRMAAAKTKWPLGRSIGQLPLLKLGWLAARRRETHRRGDHVRLVSRLKSFLSLSH
jgi:hypothetical protein